MTPDREEVIRQGRAARLFLESPVVAGALERLRAEQIRRWLEDDAPGARHMVLALDLLVGEIRTAISNGEFEETTRERERERESRRPRR